MRWRNKIIINSTRPDEGTLLVHKELYHEFIVGLSGQLDKEANHRRSSSGCRFSSEEDEAKIYDYQSNIGASLATHFKNTKNGLYVAMDKSSMLMSLGRAGHNSCPKNLVKTP
jgi:hypothetical protein